MNTQNLVKHAALGFVFILSSLLLSKLLPNNLDPTAKYNKKDIRTLGSFEIKKPQLYYGFVLDTFTKESIEIQKGETLLSILNNIVSENTNSYNIIEYAKKTFNPRIIQPGETMEVLYGKKSGLAEYLIYEPDAYRYLVFDLRTPENFKLVNKPVETSIEVVSGIMEGSLWSTIKKYNMDTDLASQMEDAMECAFDLSRAGKGDQIKLVYEKHSIEGEEVGAGKLLSAYYKGRLGEKYVFYFDNGKNKGYFDQDGRPMKKSYLQAPLKYAKISSHFSMARLHPVLNKVIPHYGTDYAAPTGTPIIAVCNGTVSEIGYNGGNGKYIKIKHDNTYSTQYLHMSRFAKGMRKGSKVSQGQTIGYVGSTGLATGPHVCFRFWKNGRQVNPRSLRLPAPNPLPGAQLAEFKTLRNAMIQKLAAVGKPIPGEKVIKINQDSLLLIPQP